MTLIILRWRSLTTDPIFCDILSHARGLRKYSGQLRGVARRSEGRATPSPNAWRRVLTHAHRLSLVRAHRSDAAARGVRATRCKLRSHDLTPSLPGRGRVSACSTSASSAPSPNPHTPRGMPLLTRFSCARTVSGHVGRGTRQLRFTPARDARRARSRPRFDDRPLRSRRFGVRRAANARPGRAAGK